MNLSSTCWGWMDHFFGPPVSIATFFNFWTFSPLTAFLFDSQLFSWGSQRIPGKSWKQHEFQKSNESLTQNKHQGSYTFFHPSENYCVQFPCQHALLLSIFSADPKNSQRLLTKWGCFSGCSFFVWWSGFHWQKRMLGFPRKNWRYIEELKGCRTILFVCDMDRF